MTFGNIHKRAIALKGHWLIKVVKIYTFGGEQIRYLNDVTEFCLSLA